MRLFAGTASAERRVALVMGDDDYRTVREMLASSEPDNALWQRDLVIAYVDYARVADNPREVLSRALEITLNLQRTGRLPAKYGYMVGAIRKMMAKLDAK